MSEMSEIQKCFINGAYFQRLIDMSMEDYKSYYEQLIAWDTFHEKEPNWAQGKASIEYANDFLLEAFTIAKPCDLNEETKGKLSHAIDAFHIAGGKPKDLEAIEKAYMSLVAFQFDKTLHHEEYDNQPEGED